MLGIIIAKLDLRNDTRIRIDALILTMVMTSNKLFIRLSTANRNISCN